MSIVKFILDVKADLLMVDREIGYNEKNTAYIPERREAEDFIDGLLALLFPKFSSIKLPTAFLLYKLYRYIFKATGEGRVARDFISSLGEIKKKLVLDVRAIFEGDPAAETVEEIILAYPGFYATAVYRIANRLHRLKIPYLPRLISEISHARTGIDIHPAAQIGESFCIDHGTGVVIGETAVIGNRVKIYQGVTIGAKSIEKDPSGQIKKGGKRHPDIADNCIIYAGATILGGDTVIGEGCIIGGNTWITRSVPAGQKIYYAQG